MLCGCWGVCEVWKWKWKWTSNGGRERKMERKRGYLKWIKMVSFDHISKHDKHCEGEDCCNHLSQIYSHIFFLLSSASIPHLFDKPSENKKEPLRLWYLMRWNCKVEHMKDKKTHSTSTNMLMPYTKLPLSNYYLLTKLSTFYTTDTSAAKIKSSPTSLAFFSFFVQIMFFWFFSTTAQLLLTL